MPPLSTFTPSEVPAIVLLMSIAAAIGALSMIICHWLAVRSSWAITLFCLFLCFLSLELFSSPYDLAILQERLVRSSVLCCPAAFFYFQWRKKAVHFLCCYGIVFFACVLSLYLGTLLVWRTSEMQSLIRPTIIIRRTFPTLEVVAWRRFIYYISLQLAPVITVAFAWMLLAIKRRPGYDIQMLEQDS